MVIFPEIYKVKEEIKYLSCKSRLFKARIKHGNKFNTLHIELIIKYNEIKMLLRFYNLILHQHNKMKKIYHESKQRKEILDTIYSKGNF